MLEDIREEEYEVEDGTALMDLLFKHIPERHANASSRWKEQIFQTEKGKITLDKNGIPSLKGYYLILINGRSYRSISEDGRRRGLRYKLKDGDEIALLPPVGGG